MVFLLVFLLEHSLKAFVLNNNKIKESYTFPHLEDLLTSPVWAAQKDTPRAIYTEKETDHTILNLEDLSVFEKILLWGQKKFLTPNTSIVRINQQLLVLDPTIPTALTEGPLIKTTSVRFELIMTLSRNSILSSNSYYKHPDLGLWKLEFQNHQLVSYAFILEEEDASLKDLAHTTSPFLESTKRKQADSFDLATLFPKDTLPGVQDLGLTYQWNQFPTYIHKALAAVFFLIAAVTYNIVSIQKWETQLQKAQADLKAIKEKIETPQYRLLKAHIEAQGSLS